MNPKLLFFLLDTAAYPLSIILLLIALKGNVDHGGPAVIRVILFLWVATLVVSLLVARLWLGSALHAFPPLLAALLIAYVYTVGPQWRNAYIPESFDEPWHEETIVRRTGKRLAGEEHGVLRYYAADGRLCRTETWRRGKQEGPCRGYHDNGELAERGVMKRVGTPNGSWECIRAGKWRFYREDGTQDDVRTYEEGRALTSKNYRYYRIFEDDGRARIYRFSDNAPFTGQLDGDGIVDEEAFPLCYTAHFVDGYFDGAWSACYPRRGFPPAGEGVARMGRSEGLYRDYHPNGQLRTEATYRDGKLEGEYVTYYADSLASAPHGRERYRCRYVDGRRHGTARWWRSDGTPDTEAEYRNGKREGICLEYDDEGRLQLEIPYRDGRREGMGIRYETDGSLTALEFCDDERVAEHPCDSLGRPIVPADRGDEASGGR